MGHARGAYRRSVEAMTALIRRAGAGKVYPLIRKNGDGWEMLRIGSLAEGQPVYEAVEWDHAAWEARQRAAEAIRRSFILEPPVAGQTTAQAVTYHRG